MTFPLVSRSLTRRTIIEVICPLAPFLLPAKASLILCRNLQGGQILGLRAYSNENGRLRKTTKKSPVRRRYPRYSLDQLQDVTALEALTLDFRIAVNSGDVSAAMNLYPRMIEHQTLTRGEILATARMLHTHYRIKRFTAQQDKEALLNHFQMIISDLKHGKAPPHPVAHVHIISYFKESKQFDLGEEYWDWLVQQDDVHLDARTYGSAIELLAYRGESLPVLEGIYKQALKRFPGQFSEYHLSPGAIIVNPKQETAMTGTRMVLLQGILTARVLRGDWRNAYLALDTALRLYPTQVPTRFFELLIYERPLPEAYRVFLIACRSERVPSSKLFIHLLDSLAASSKNYTYLTKTKAMFNALHVYIGSGGKINSPCVNKLTDHILSHLPYQGTSISNHGTLNEQETVFKVVVGTFQRLIDLTSGLGALPEISIFNNMITIGGKKQRRDLIDHAWTEISRLDLLPNDVTWRVTMLAGGYLEDADMVKEAWSNLKAAKPEGVALDIFDWKAYADAGRKVGLTSLVTSELPLDQDAVSEEIRTEVRKKVMEIPRFERLLRSRANANLEEEELLQSLDFINQKLSSITELIMSYKRIDFYQNPISMKTLDMQSSLPQEELRAIYNKLTRDPVLESDYAAGSGSQTEAEPAATTAIGFPLDELRFQNWCAVNDLLIDADRNEELKRSAVDKAIKTGEPVKRVYQDIKKNENLERVSPSLEAYDCLVTSPKSSVHYPDKPEGSTSKQGRFESQEQSPVEGLKDKILRLRGHVRY